MMSCVKIFSITKIAPINKSFSGEEDLNDKSRKFNVPHFIDLGKVYFSILLLPGPLKLFLVSGKFEFGYFSLS